MTLAKAIARERGPRVSFSSPLALLAVLSVAVLLFLHQTIRPQHFTAGFVPSSFAHLLESIEIVNVVPITLSDELAMSHQALLDRWNPFVEEASQRFGVPASWIRAVIRQESGGRTMLDDGAPITSSTGAMGVMQLMPETYQEMRASLRLGADPYNPHDSIMAGAAYLSLLKRKYGFPNMFAAYNDGPGNLEKHLAGGRELPAETVNYLANITAHLESDRVHRRRSRATRLAQN